MYAASRLAGDWDSAERLLLALVDVMETATRIYDWPVQSWHYEELAKLYRRRGDYAAEVAIIERFKRQPHLAASALLSREARARALLAGDREQGHDDDPASDS